MLPGPHTLCACRGAVCKTGLTDPDRYQLVRQVHTTPYKENMMFVDGLDMGGHSIPLAMLPVRRA